MLVNKNPEISKTFLLLATEADVFVQYTGGKWYSLFGLNERYHHPVKPNCRNNRMSEPNLSLKMAPSMTVKGFD